LPWRFSRRRLGLKFRPALELGTGAKEQAAKAFYTEFGFLQGKHQPKIHADDLLQPPRHRRGQIALMNLSDERLALFAT
jgi:hypothetical protein